MHCRVCRQEPFALIWHTHDPFNIFLSQWDNWGGWRPTPTGFHHGWKVLSICEGNSWPAYTEIIRIYGFNLSVMVKTPATLVVLNTTLSLDLHQGHYITIGPTSVCRVMTLKAMSWYALVSQWSCSLHHNCWSLDLFRLFPSVHLGRSWLESILYISFSGLWVSMRKLRHKRKKKMCRSRTCSQHPVDVQPLRNSNHLTKVSFRIMFLHNEFRVKSMVLVAQKGQCSIHTENIWESSNL